MLTSRLSGMAMTSVLAALTIVLSILDVDAQDKPCIIKGHLFTQLPWYGYIVQKTFQNRAAKVQYQFSFPVHSAPKILIYHDDQMRYLKEGMTCEEREGILPVDNHQIIPLTPNKTAGCNVQSDTDGPIVVCTGERNFASTAPKTWYFVVSRCKDTRLLSFWYYFNMTGYYGDCEADPLAKTYVPPPRFEEHQYINIIVTLGVISGVALTVLVVFVSLWCRLRRRGCGKDKSNESLTSSQATMTQDIFFVNTALPPDRDTSDYSRSSSENYYEVIPDRRSYESVDADRLTVPGRLHHRGPYASRSIINHNNNNQNGHALYHHHNRHHLTLPSRSRQPGVAGVPDPRSLQRAAPPSHHSYPASPEDYPPPPYPMQRIIRSSYPNRYSQRRLNLTPDQHETLLATMPVSGNSSPHSHSQLVPLAETLA